MTDEVDGFELLLHYLPNIAPIIRHWLYIILNLYPKALFHCFCFVLCHVGARNGGANHHVSGGVV